MDYSEALAQIKILGLSRGVVSGPQRAGTTICAKMLALDLGLEFLSEAWLEGGRPVQTLNRILVGHDRFVIQAPGPSRHLHKLALRGAFVVWMRRDMADIVASQERVKWDDTSQLRAYDAQQGPIAQVKLDFWRQRQRGQIEHAFEIEYESLTVHPLWVPKEDRADWHERQISADNRFRPEIFIREK